MADLKISYDSLNLDFDLNVLNGDLESDDGLETAVLMSLYTDKRISDDDPILDYNNPEDKRGWWGDLLVPFEEGDEIGSKIWLLSREKTTQDVIVKLQSYIEESLAWLVNDQIVSKAEVEIERQNPLPENNILAFKIKLYKIDGREIALNYSYQWDATI
jgi:phage gp46-like protein